MRGVSHTKFLSQTTSQNKYGQNSTLLLSDTWKNNFMSAEFLSYFIPEVYKHLSEMHKISLYAFFIPICFFFFCDFHEYNFLISHIHSSSYSVIQFFHCLRPFSISLTNMDLYIHHSYAFIWATFTYDWAPYLYRFTHGRKTIFGFIFV